MTVLSVAQSVAKRVGLANPSGFMSSTDRALIELQDIMLEAALDIASGHDWQALRKQATLTGDGSTESYDFPADYDRMLEKAQLWSSSLEAPLSHILESDRWLGLDVQSFDFVVNAWTIYGGQIHVKPALASGVTAKYFYMSDLIFAQSDGTPIREFSADTDTFRISERLLKLATIWRWKESKGQAYGEAMADFERAKEREIKSDTGSKMLAIGTARVPRGATIAYPVAIEG